MQSVGFVEPGLSVSREVEGVAVSVVDAAPLLLDVLHVELLAADQRIGLENKLKMSSFSNKVVAHLILQNLLNECFPKQHCLLSR